MSNMIVYTGGTFDLFHAGHARLLKRCHDLAEGGMVVVAVNTDDFVESYKERPICTLVERMEAVAACKWVDAVIVNEGGADSKPAIESVRPNIIVVGSDWEARDYHHQMGFTPEWLEHRRISIKFVPYTETISSTIIKSRILDRMWQ